MRQYKQVRMRLQTYEALKKIVPPYEGEMLINWIERVSNRITRRLNEDEL
jgi:hypothetical protein|tara:strand:- start:284 stop:433 length:150 start_codon:yes stop_codon:yes gene_type:complete